MIFNKLGYISNNSVKALRLIEKLSKYYNLCEVTNTTKDLDVILVIGGDGTLLHTLRSYMKLNIPFYGINTGNIGFLMNEVINLNELSLYLNTSHAAILYPLKAIINTVDKNQYTVIAINEISLFRKSYRIAKFRILINDVEQMPILMSDGVLVATPAGSTAYNLSAGGPVLPLKTNLLCLTPICPFRPRRWKGALVSHNSKIDFEIKDPIENPVNAVADFQEIQNIAYITIEEIKNESITLLFNKHQNLHDRIIKEQFYSKDLYVFKD